MIVYGEQNQDYCRYRTLSGSSWSDEQSATNVGNNPKWYVAKSCPTRTEVAVCTLNNNDDIYLQFWTGSAWTGVTMLTDNAGSSVERTYDIAYEQSSGDLLIAYRATSDATLHYRTATSSSNLSAQLSVGLPTTGNIKWVKLIPKSGSNEVFALTLDSNKQTAGLIWNGSAWGNALQLDTNGKVASNEQFAGAYEGLSGRALAAWSENSLNSIRYRIWSGSAWLAENTGPALPKEPQWIELAADPLSNQMVMATMDGSEDIILTVWNGSAWGSPLTIETNSPGVDRRPFDVAYERTSGRAVVIWGRAAQNNFYYRTWNGSAWSAEQAGPGLTDKVSYAQLINAASGNEIYLTILQTGSGALQSFIWNGTSFSPRVQLEVNCSGPNTTESHMVTSSSSGGSSSSYAVDWRN
jgi:hypothetical protein